ncbi:klf1 Zinc finger protein klf1 [Candida maltosa Xu316]
MSSTSPETSTNSSVNTPDNNVNDTTKPSSTSSSRKKSVSVANNNNNNTTTTTKKKKRSLGVFPCTHCDKIFTRSDHLARHNLNHEPKEVYVCEFMIDYHGSQTKCGKSFVRKDLKERHIKRHYELLKLDSETGNNNNKPTTRKRKESVSSTTSSTSSGMQISNLVDEHDKSPQRKIVKLEPSQQYIQAMNNTITNNHLPPPPQNQTPIPVANSSSSQQSSPRYPTTMQFNNQNNLNNLYKSYGTTIPQNDILSWLFNDSPQGSLQVNSSPEAAQLQQQLQQQQQQQQQQQMQLPPNSGVPPVIPSPYGGSQFSPMADHIQAGIIGNPTTSQVGFSNNFPAEMTAFSNSYGTDINIFSNNDNPLDEVFYRNYQSMQNPHQLSTVNQHENGLPNLGLSLSSASPTNTVESSNDNATEGSQDESKLLHHAEKNTPENKSYFVDAELFNDILQSVSVSRQDLPFETKAAVEDRISFYLYSYWKHFHTQFTFLHKPSFDTKRTAEPLLLVAMIAVGACYSFPETAEALAKEYKQSPEFKFTLQLAKPLRFAIFEHEDFKSPVKLWILQSLNMLEWIEKNFLTRRMHERAHLHHGTTVQLLRRSPILGGNPTQNKKGNTSNSSSAGEESELEEKNNTSDNTDRDLFDQWVESESMKRITFMTFYLDITDNIKFRHNPQILFYQLQLLNLPCDDEHLWESNDVNGSFKKLVKRQRKLQDNINNDNGKKKKVKSDSFLAALKKLLKPSKSNDFKNKSIFTQKILLAGLISLMYQMQQTDLQNSSSLLSTQTSHVNNKVWKEMLIRAFDNWYFERMQGFTTDIPNQNVPFPIFYLTQIIGLPEINHYDIAIYTGSPANQSVDATLKDHYIVQQKLNNIWSKNNKNPENLRGIIYCYKLLVKLMFDEQGKPLDWYANCDYYDVMNAVSNATLVLWSYCFSTNGLESHKYSEQNQDFTNLPFAEDGYHYLSRIKDHFVKVAKPDGPEAISKYVAMLPQIPNKQNISGLCFLISSKLMNSQWEIIREHAKLIFNCGLRSIGKRTVLCEDLFTNEFK